MTAPGVKVLGLEGFRIRRRRAAAGEHVKEFPSLAVIPDIRRGDSRDGKQSPGIVSSAPPRCVLRSGSTPPCGGAGEEVLDWGIVSHVRSLGTTQNCFIRAVALCPAKRRFAFSPMGSHARLAAEIPDIFLPLARNDVRNDDGGGTCPGAAARGVLVFCFFGGRCCV